LENALTKKRRPSFIIFGSVILLVVFFFGYSVLNSHMQQSKASKTGRSIDAIVLSSQVRSMHAGGIGRSVTYYLDVKYRYTVNEKAYVSDNFSYMGTTFNDYGKAAAALKKFHEGHKIKVFYNPATPSQAVINKTPPPLPIYIMATPFLFFSLIGVLMIIAGTLGTKPKSGQI